LLVRRELLVVEVNGEGRRWRGLES